MRRVEVTAERRTSLTFDVTDDELDELVRERHIPDIINRQFDEHFVTDYWVGDFAVWDCDKQEQLVDWS